MVCFSIEDILAESDSDLSEDEGKAQKKTGKVQKGRAWLKEGEEDDPLNFLDPKVSQRVLGKTSSINEPICTFWGVIYSMLCLSNQPGSEEEQQGEARLQGNVRWAADNQRGG